MHELSRDSILKAEDLAREKVDLSDCWGGYVYVRCLTADERDRFETEIVAARERPADLAGVRARLVAAAVVDGQGKPLFTAADVPALGKKSAKAIDRLFEIARRLSGMTEESREAARKNSEAAPSCASSCS